MSDLAASLSACNVRLEMGLDASRGRRPEGRRLVGSESGDDAPMLAGDVGVGRDRAGRYEVEVALER